MTTDSDVQAQGGGVFGCFALIVVFSLLGTLFTDWIGLSAYPIPILMVLLAAASFFVGTTAVQGLTLKQTKMIWVSGAVVSLLTMLSLTPPQPNAESNPVANSNLTSAAAAADAMPNPQTALQADGTSTGASQPSQLASNPTVVAPLDTTIDELLSAFEENQVAAAKKFGRPLRVSGKVMRVREAFGTGIIVLASPRSGQEQELGFSDSGTEKLSDIKRGDMVIVTCPEALEAMSVVIVGGCSDVEVK